MKASGYAILYDVPDSEGTIYEKGCLDNVDLSSVKVTDGKNKGIRIIVWKNIIAGRFLLN